jgi:RNA polymerase sigma-32 factor
MLASTSDCFKLYVRHAYSYPVLTKEEEFSYANKMSTEDCLDSAKKLISSHLRYVIAIAKGYSGYGLPADDLIQEGTIGLMKATKSFDHLKGNRLSTFSSFWIKAEMLSFILKNFKTAKIATTKEQRKLFFNLR